MFDDGIGEFSIETEAVVRHVTVFAGSSLFGYGRGFMSSEDESREGKTIAFLLDHEVSYLIAGIEPRASSRVTTSYFHSNSNRNLHPG